MVGGLWAELLRLSTAPLSTEDAFELWYAVFWRQKRSPLRLNLEYRYSLIIPIDFRATSREFLASKPEKATLAKSVMMHGAAPNRALPSAIGSEINSYENI